jgi:hypothetical protein
VRYLILSQLIDLLQSQRSDEMFVQIMYPTFPLLYPRLLPAYPASQSSRFVRFHAAHPEPMICKWLMAYVSPQCLCASLVSGEMLSNGQMEMVGQEQKHEVPTPLLFLLNITSFVGKSLTAFLCFLSPPNPTPLPSKCLC